ncbi:hypothetical protein H4R34_000257 [Dimargaris verticillata]|uniref:HTH APSES-type domain-containing protein n=1 Tax=Dimargaris verticillata TaxID=2761393 RepID=A0A9W8EG40_9FUNG|nr:hypothetical protein H4R34_000257 [Dimargaris verticillata]
MDNSLDQNTPNTITTGALMPSYSSFTTYSQAGSQMPPHTPQVLHGYPHPAHSHHAQHQLAQLSSGHRFASQYAPQTATGPWTTGPTAAMPWPSPGSANGTLLNATALPSVPSALAGHWSMFPNATTSLGHATDGSGHAQPHPYPRGKLTTTLWEDEGTMCYQVDARGYCVARRQDNNMINGTKLLNVVGMSRGKRDGILKNEKGRVVVKVGAMHLKGVWIPFCRARTLAAQYNILEVLYPLFVDDPSLHLYSPTLYSPTSPINQQQQQQQRVAVSNVSAGSLGMSPYRPQYSNDPAYLSAMATHPTVASGQSSVTNSPGSMHDLAHGLSGMMTVPETNGGTNTMGDASAGNATPASTMANSGVSNTMMAPAHHFAYPSSMHGGNGIMASSQSSAGAVARSTALISTRSGILPGYDRSANRYAPYGVMAYPRRNSPQQPATSTSSPGYAEAMGTSNHGDNQFVPAGAGFNGNNPYAMPAPRSQLAQLASAAEETAAAYASAPGNHEGDASNEFVGYGTTTGHHESAYANSNGCTHSDPAGDATTYPLGSQAGESGPHGGGSSATLSAGSFQSFQNHFQAISLPPPQPPSGFTTGSPSPADAAGSMYTTTPTMQSLGDGSSSANLPRIDPTVKKELTEPSDGSSSNANPALQNFSPGFYSKSSNEVHTALHKA